MYKGKRRGPRNNLCGTLYLTLRRTDRSPRSRRNKSIFNFRKSVNVLSPRLIIFFNSFVEFSLVMAFALTQKSFQMPFLLTLHLGDLEGQKETVFSIVSF